MNTETRNFKEWMNVIFWMQVFQTAILIILLIYFILT